MSLVHFLLSVVVLIAKCNFITSSDLQNTSNTRTLSILELYVTPTSSINLKNVSKYGTPSTQKIYVTPTRSINLKIKSKNGAWSTQKIYVTPTRSINLKIKSKNGARSTQKIYVTPTKSVNLKYVSKRTLSTQNIYLTPTQKVYLDSTISLHLRNVTLTSLMAPKNSLASIPMQTYTIIFTLTAINSAITSRNITPLYASPTSKASQTNFKLTSLSLFSNQRSTLPGSVVTKIDTSHSQKPEISPTSKLTEVATSSGEHSSTVLLSKSVTSNVTKSLEKGSRNVVSTRIQPHTNATLSYVATSSVIQTNTTTLTTHKPVKKDDEEILERKWWYVIGAGAFIIVLLIIAVVCIKRRKKKADKPKEHRLTYSDSRVMLNNTNLDDVKNPSNRTSLTRLFSKATELTDWHNRQLVAKLPSDDYADLNMTDIKDQEYTGLRTYKRGEPNPVFEDEVDDPQTNHNKSGTLPHTEVGADYFQFEPEDKTKNSTMITESLLGTEDEVNDNQTNHDKSDTLPHTGEDAGCVELEPEDKAETSAVITESLSGTEDEVSDNQTERKNPDPSETN
ncbi:uncharacterized protein LOC130623596 [Hydractinia symbiolongicarpus]|uniref:uncharacterized protein LOC130623596 n=1 Tax=Hydractinia symbiolongicarpus TaxID=13093 RepID=UPI00254CF349|nr:uncharacterized protein LOC130623596 [Hydractinia symbiolongicarpus]